MAIIWEPLQTRKKSLILTSLIPSCHSNGLQAVTDNSPYLENQTKLQHSSPAPGTTWLPAELKFNPVQKYEKAKVQVGSNNTHQGVSDSELNSDAFQDSLTNMC